MCCNCTLIKCTLERYFSLIKRWLQAGQKTRTHTSLSECRYASGYKKIYTHTHFDSIRPQFVHGKPVTLLYAPPHDHKHYANRLRGSPTYAMYTTQQALTHTQTHAYKYIHLQNRLSIIIHRTKSMQLKYGGRRMCWAMLCYMLWK